MSICLKARPEHRGNPLRVYANFIRRPLFLKLNRAQFGWNDQRSTITTRR